MWTIYIANHSRKARLLAPESRPWTPWIAKSKNIRTSEAAPGKSGDCQPEQRTLVVPLRQCPRLVVYLPVQWPLPPSRGTTACPSTVAHITKTNACSFYLLASHPRVLSIKVSHACGRIAIRGGSRDG